MLYKSGEEWVNGKEDWDRAIAIAEKCNFFEMDVEEELVSDDPTSCYNCRFRRWTAKSITCMKPIDHP